MKVMRAYIEKRCIFKTLYMDREGILGGPKRSNFSQIQRACDELAIEIIFAIKHWQNPVPGLTPR